MIIGLAWTPFWLGSNRLTPWGVNGIYFPSLALAYEGYLIAGRRRHPVGLQNYWVPATLFATTCCWALAQATPSFAPSLAHPIWQLAAEALERPITGAISVNPSQTRLTLVRLLTSASVFWLCAQLCRDSARARFLLFGVAAVTAVYSGYGLILSTFFSGRIPFFDVEEAGAAVRSTFVNRNSFATYAGIGLIVTLGLIMELLSENISDRAGLWRQRLAQLIETSGHHALPLWGGALVILAALLGSASRGGALSTGFAVFALLWLVGPGRQKSRREPAILAAVAVGAGFIFLGDTIVARISVNSFQDANRLSVYRIIVGTILDAPIQGFGYGTFADVFPMYRDRSISSYEVWDKAHNTYLETWQGLGLVFGSTLIGAVIWIAVKCFIGAIRRHRLATPCCIAASVSLLVALHALVDFSLQIEAVALTYAAILGAGFAQSESSRLIVSD